MKRIFLAVFGLTFWITNVFADVTVGKAVTFSAKSEGATSYEWTFPGGAKVTGQKATHVFTKIGTQEIKLVVSDGITSKEVIKTILVRNEKKPTAVIQVYKNGSKITENTELIKIIRTDKLSFVSNSINADGGKEDIIESWKISGRVVSKEQISNFLDKAGSYTIKLLVTDKDDQNLRDERTLTIEVTNAPPEIVKPLSFKKDSVLGTSNVILSTLATDEDGEIDYYRFEVLEYGAVVSAKISQTNEASFNLAQFSGEHQYKFKAVAVDNEGAITEVFSDQVLETNEFFQNSAPKVSILVSPSTVGSLATNFMFQAEASDLDGDALDYKWTFPGGENKFAEAVNHRFATAGDMQVKLEVSDGIEKTETSLTVKILGADNNLGKNTAPEATILGVSPGNTGDTNTVFSFHSQASDIDKDQLSYEWDFGNGQKIFLQNVSYKFPISGIYKVKLKVSDGLETSEKSISLTIVNAGEDIPPSSVDPYQDTHSSALTGDNIKINAPSDLKKTLEAEKAKLLLELETTTDPTKRSEIQANIALIDKLLAEMANSGITSVDDLNKKLEEDKNKLLFESVNETDLARKEEIEKQILVIESFINRTKSFPVVSIEDLNELIGNVNKGYLLELEKTTEFEKQKEIKIKINMADTLTEKLVKFPMMSLNELQKKLETKNKKYELELEKTIDAKEREELRANIAVIDEFLNGIKKITTRSASQIKRKLEEQKDRYLLEIQNTKDYGEEAELKSKILMDEALLNQIQSMQIVYLEEFIKELETEKAQLLAQLGAIEDGKNVEIQAQINTIEDILLQIKYNFLDKFLGFDSITIQGNTNTIFFIYGKAPISERALLFEWNLGDGQTYIGQNFSKRYKTPGIYTLQLKVSDGLTTVFDSLKIRVEE